MTTFLLTAVLIADVALIILAGAALLPVKVIMSTMPKELREATKEHPNPPLWKMAIGFVILAFGVAAALWVFFFAGDDAVRQGSEFWGIFARYMIMLYGFKLFDIICLDWWLITKSRFFQHFFPETEGSKGYKNFGFNRKEQLAQMVAFPFVSGIIAALWCWLG